MATVKAVRVHEHGGPEVLRWEEVDVPAPGRGEVRIRHTAIGLNFIDIYHRTGLYPTKLPMVPGEEAAGVVEELGPGVSDVRVGDRVAYTGLPGAYCEERNARSERLVKLPDEIPDEVAAAMLLKGMTAEYLLHRTRPLQGSDTIVFHAAAGGVGLIACQWASALGAQVIGVVGSEQKADIARSHGCHHVVVFPKEDLVERVDELTGGRGVPVVYDSVGKDTFEASLDCLSPRGLLVLFGQSSGKVPPFDPGVLSQKGSLYLTRPTLKTYVATREELEKSANALFDVVKRKKVRVEINQRYPLREAARAHADLEGRRTTGSTVLTV
jgi:NADPH2:quinone reductase